MLIIIGNFRPQWIVYTQNVISTSIKFQKKIFSVSAWKCVVFCIRSGWVLTKGYITIQWNNNEFILYTALNTTSEAEICKSLTAQSSDYYINILKLSLNGEFISTPSHYANHAKWSVFFAVLEIEIPKHINMWLWLITLACNSYIEDVVYSSTNCLLVYQSKSAS